MNFYRKLILDLLLCRLCFIFFFIFLLSLSVCLSFFLLHFYRTDFSNKIATLQSQIDTVVLNDIRREIQSNDDRIHDSIAPYSRFIEIEKKKVSSALEVLVALRKTTREIQNKLRWIDGIICDQDSTLLLITRMFKIRIISIGWFILFYSVQVCNLIIFYKSNQRLKNILVIKFIMKLLFFAVFSVLKVLPVPW